MTDNFWLLGVSHIRRKREQYYSDKKFEIQPSQILKDNHDIDLWHQHFGLTPLLWTSQRCFCLVALTWRHCLTTTDATDTKRFPWHRLGKKVVLVHFKNMKSTCNIPVQTYILHETHAICLPKCITNATTHADIRDAASRSHITKSSSSPFQW